MIGWFRVHGRPSGDGFCFNGKIEGIGAVRDAIQQIIDLILQDAFAVKGRSVQQVLVRPGVIIPAGIPYLVVRIPDNRALGILQAIQAFFNSSQGTHDLGNPLTSNIPEGSDLKYTHAGIVDRCNIIFRRRISGHDFLRCVHDSAGGFRGRGNDRLQLQPGAGDFFLL